MGYTTDFVGSFKLDKPLTPSLKEFLDKFNGTRRMKRNQDPEFGIDGEFFVDGSGPFGQGRDSDIVEFNGSPSTQPGLWCQWKPTADGTGIEWDGGEKFYYYTDWLFYIINKILIPNGYTLNGEVMWQGEEVGDVGKLVVEDNKVFEEPFGGRLGEFKSDSMQLDVVYKDQTLPEEALPETLPVEDEEDEEKKILRAKVDALTAAMKNMMNPTLVDKILEEIEEKAKA